VRIVWTRQAQVMLDGAVDYIAAERPAAALRWLDETMERVRSLERFPDLGASFLNCSGLRSARSLSARIACRITGTSSRSRFWPCSMIGACLSLVAPMSRVGLTSASSRLTHALGWAGAARSRVKRKHVRFNLDSRDVIARGYNRGIRVFGSLR